MKTAQIIYENAHQVFLLVLILHISCTKITLKQIIIHVNNYYNILRFFCMLYIFTFIKLLHMLDVLYAFDLVHTGIQQNK